MSTTALSKRGIQTLASQHGWSQKHNGYQYPTFDPFTGATIGTRFKRTSGDGAKYLWIPGKPAHEYVEWYILPNTVQAIKDADGVVYIANGEASVLAHHTAQVYNTIATTLSEVAVPANTVALFQQIGVSRVIFLADNDTAGTKYAAKNWRDALIGSGMDFEARYRGIPYAEGYDTNDLWIDSGFNADTFQDLLGSLEILALPSYEPKKEYTFDETDFTETPQGLIDLLASALNVKSWRATGWSKNVSSPFHEDKKPSFGIRQDTGVGKDFATDESYSPTQIADKLGIDWTRFYPKKTGASRNDTKLRDVRRTFNEAKAKIEETKTLEMYESPAFPAGYQSWIDQRYLPESWVKALLGLAVSNSAVVPVFLTLHDAFRTGKLNPQCFNRKQLDALIGSRKKSTTAALETLVTWGFVSFLHTNSNKEYSDENDTKLKNGGRPTQYCYRIASTDKGLNGSLISDMMTRKVIETIGKRTLSPRTLTIAFELGLSRAEALEWQERCKVATDNHAQFLIDMLVKKWRDDLWNYAPLVIELDEFSNAKDIRVKLIRDFLADKPNGIQISNAELSMMLGCSESNLSSVYKEANIKTQQMRVWVQVSENLHKLNLDAELKKAQKENQGRALAIKIQYRDEGHEKGFGYTPLLFGESNMYSGLANNRNNMTKLYIMVEQPSLIYIASAIAGFYIAYLYQFAIIAYAIQELAKKIELGIDAVSTADSEPIEDNGAEVEAEPGITVKKKRTPAQSGKVDRDWTSFNPEWLRDQLDLEAHIFTQEAFIPDGLNLKQSLKWIKDNAQAKPVRTVASYYDKDDGDSTLINLAKFLGGKQAEGLATRKITKPVEVKEILPFDGGENPYLEDTPASTKITAEYAKPSDKAIELMMKQSDKPMEKRASRFSRGA